MTQARKQGLLISILLCIVAIFVINAALPLHIFETGKPFPSSNQMIKPQATSASGSDAPSAKPMILKGSLSILLFIIAAYFLFLVFRKTTWKQIARITMILLAVLLFIFILSLINPQQVQVSPAVQESTIEVIPFTYRTEPIQSPPIAWQWISAVFIFILIAGGIAYFIFREPKQENLETKIARKAKSAIQALQAGDDYRSVILYCYQEMSSIIQESENINREEAMTVREFENSLQKTDLPIAAVQQLSRLFENARYSKTEPSAEDQQQCLSSLQQIIEHCQPEGSSQ